MGHSHRGVRVAAVAVGTGLLALSAIRWGPARAAGPPASPPAAPAGAAAPAAPAAPQAPAAPADPAQAGAAYQEALRLLGQGDLSGAEQRLRQAVGAKPDLADAWNDLSLVLARQARYPEAVEAAHRALALRPDFPYAQYNLGWALLGTADWNQAQGPLAATMQAQPYRPEPLWAMGRLAERAGGYDSAAGYYGRAVAMGYGPAVPDLAFAEMLVAAEAAGAKIDPARLTRLTAHLSGPGRLDQAAAWPGGLAFRAEGQAPVYLPQDSAAPLNPVPFGLGVVGQGGHAWLALAAKSEVQLFAYREATGGLQVVFLGQGDLAGFEGNDVYTAVRGNDGRLDISSYVWNAGSQKFAPDQSFYTNAK